ncbi:hypothetical protein [Bacillus phage phiAGATE]|uniref:Uncharacterized protein n=1 Tax=Bacillus phage phiAGATE TaxID=1204533 RepID=L0LBY0_9CAUD|nr:hypothetical protein G380_gp155 [Bacillus phage phiAGATE]AGB62601.1 hypothetical protein [Bacillus phage phiAGATE]
MIVSVDTYLHNEIESKLKIILENRYIIEEILKGVKPSIAANFINAYAGADTVNEIPIVYAMPQDRHTQKGAIYIGLREGVESKSSIGNLEGDYLFKEEGTVTETSTIQASADNSKLFIEVEKEIGLLINVAEITFATSDNVTTKGNRIYFTYDEELIGMDVTVHYEVKGDEEAGFKRGFTATEQYSILAISTNMDTVRCLDLIIKAIMILMRSNAEESNNFQLQKLQFGQTEEIPVNTDVKPEILYGRETIVSYTSSYSLDSPITDAILEHIKVTVHLNNEQEERADG